MLLIEKVNIDSVSPDPANVRKHNDRNLQTMKASLRKYGQQKPIVVDGRNVILAGNGLWTAAKALGWESIEVVRTDLKGSDATGYAIADNRSAELAEWDGKLAEVLASLQKEDFDLESVGYSAEEIDKLISKAMAFDNPDAAEHEYVEGQEGPENTRHNVSIVCPAESSEDVLEDVRRAVEGHAGARLYA